MYKILRRFTRFLYRFNGTGLPRIAEYIRKKVAVNAPSKAILINDFFDAKFYCHLQEHMGGMIFFRGSYSGEQLDIVKKVLPVDGVFMDIGANHGEFTVFAAQVATKGRVLSFEPIKKHLERLNRNIKINNFDNVEVFPVALADKEGEFPVYDASKTFLDGTHHEGLHTLHSTSVRHETCGLVEVKVLDDVLAKIELPRLDLMKIDIEGSELSALKGGVQTLEKYTPTILIEIARETCNTAGYEMMDIVLFLRKHGYQIYKITNHSSLSHIKQDNLDDFQNVVAIHDSRMNEVNERLNY